jgi:hypothetical protein
MKCSRIVEHFLELEDNLSIPLSIRLHILFCRECRGEIFVMRDTFKSFRNTAPFEMTGDISDFVMYRIKGFEKNFSNTISSFKWLMVGSVILASIFLIPFSNSLLWLKVHFGRDLLIPLNIVMGLAISIYSVFVIGAHIDELKTFMNSLYRKTR